MEAEEGEAKVKCPRRRRGILRRQGKEELRQRDECDGYQIAAGADPVPAGDH
jgi:hypothetical protein